MAVRTENRSARLLNAAKSALPSALKAGGLILETGVKERLSERTYPPASAPGQSPAIRTGHLRRSITTKVEVSGYAGVVKVGPQADYGKDLEFGTSKMAARPYMRPTLEADGKQAQQTVIGILQKAMSV